MYVAIALSTSISLPVSVFVSVFGSRSRSVSIFSCGRVNFSVLSVVSFRYLLGIQMDMLGRQMNTWVWRSGERSGEGDINLRIISI